MISIHAPTGGATGQAYLIPYRNKDFNPRSHGGSDSGRINDRDQRNYFNPRSHGGSDKYIPVNLCSNSRFQSTLPRGERRYHPQTEKPKKDFNPRSHGGSDRSEQRKLGSVAVISIHAPTGGATSILIMSASIRLFQSTLPRGERLNVTSIGAATENFNPRSHGGSDGTYRVPMATQGISIHAPTGGATRTDW